jgi:HD-like signal output (HDOD) protein
MREIDDFHLIESILASGLTIPPMPALLLNILALEGNENAGARDFAALIKRDPDLAGAVFRVVGSPLLGLRAKVTSLEHAITLLGIRTTLAVVRSEGLRGALVDPGLAPMMARFWGRMNTVADVVLGLARALRIKGVREDQAFLAGIFHDCGVALLARQSPDYAREFMGAVAWPNPLPLDATYDTSHCLAGLLLARNWQLPDDVALAVRHHHDNDLADLPEAARKMIVLVQFACHLIAQRDDGDDSEWQSVWRSCATELFQDVGADMEDLEENFL